MKQLNFHLFYLHDFLQNHLFGVLLFMFVILSNESKSQTVCNPPIPFNPGIDATISCGGSTQIGETPSASNPDYTLAPTCKHTARFQNNSLTQGGGIYINDVTTTGGNVNINNTGTLVDAGHIDPMGPNAWSTIWLSDFSTAHFVETCSGNTFNLNINARSLYNNRPYFCRVWIDWDNSGTFTPAEIAYTSPAINTHPNINITNVAITVPAGQPYGAFRMRIRFKDNAPFVAADGACTYTNPQGIVAPYGGYTGNQTGSYTFSDEIEDYSVHVNCGNATGGNDLTYSWSPPDGLNDTTIPNPTATPTETTTYTVTITDTINNCITTEQVTVTVPSITPTFTNPGPICTGTSFALPTTSNNGITGTWEPAIDNTQTTTYTFTPNNGQCAITATMEVIVNPETVPVFDSPDPICPGTSFTLPTISNNGITGTWTPTIDNTQTTTYTFTPDNAGCASSTTLTVTVENQVTPTFTNPGPICSGTSFTLPTTSNNGITGTWTPAIDNTQTTTYSFIPDNAGCSASTTLTVVVDNQAIPTFTNPGPICSGASFTLPNTSNNGITGTWTPAIDNTQTTTYTFTPDNAGCAVSTTMTVAVNNQITPAFTNIAPVCSGTSFTLPTTSNNGITGTWSPAIDNTQTTTYTFTPDNTGCALPTTMTVVINSGFNLTLSNGVDVCQGENISPVVITAAGGSAPYTFTYSVDNGNPVTITSSQNTAIIDLANYPGFNTNNSRCYNIKTGGSDAGSCQTEDTVFVNHFCIHPTPEASFSVSPGNNGVYSMTNTSNGATSYLWDLGNHSSTDEHVTHHFPTENTGNYTIRLIAYSEKGCSDTTYQVITIEEDLIFYVPNTFTPDGDEYNNIFRPVITSGYDPFDYQLEIYNRWGQCIFISNHPDKGWDGTYNGNLSQDGTYTWKLNLKVKYNDDKKTHVGHVSIIR